MQVFVSICENLDKRRVESLLSALRISNVQYEPCEDNPDLKVEDGTYRIEVSSVDDNWDSNRIASILKRPISSALLFNSEAEEKVEPKVIYTTDHSQKAVAQLEQFKKLKPQGFAGATVVSDHGTLSVQDSWSGSNRQLRGSVQSALRASLANLIIANYDSSQSGNLLTKISDLADLVQESKCHVMILKA